MTGPEAVQVIFEALRPDGRLRVTVLANEGLIVEALDGDQFLIEVAEHR